MGIIERENSGATDFVPDDYTDYVVLTYVPKKEG